jgi:hypothetical protein
MAYISFPDFENFQNMNFYIFIFVRVVLACLDLVPEYGTGSRMNKEGGEGRQNVVCPGPEFVNVKVAQESIPPDFVAWSAGMTNSVIIAARQAT